MEIPQELKFGNETLEALKRGVDKVANAVKITLGPKGRTVGIVKEHYQIFTKDGVSVAKAIRLEDPYENAGARATIEAAEKANNIGGDGTTATTILVQAMVGGAFSALKSGASFPFIRDGLYKALDVVNVFLNKLAKPVKTYEQTKAVASISANDSEMGSHIANLFQKVGKEGVLVVEESKNIVGYEEEYVNGCRWEKGLISPYMVSDPVKRRLEFLDVPILFTTKAIEQGEELYPLLETLKQGGVNKLLIVCNDMTGTALATVFANGQKGVFFAGVVRAPYASTSQLAALEDMAALTGGEVICEEKGFKLPTIASEVDLSVLGHARRVVCDMQATVIVDGKGNKKKINQRIAEIKSELKRVDLGDWEKTKLKERLSRLTGSVGILRFGAENESKSKEMKYRIEDSVNATRNALEEGIVPGGEVALLRASRELDKLKLDGDEARGVEIIKQALVEPIKVLADNAGASGNQVAKKVLEGTGSFGYDAAKDEYGDMIEKNIIDPLKVVRSAVNNAVATTSILLTTGCLITDKEIKQDKEKGV